MYILVDGYPFSFQLVFSDVGKVNTSFLDSLLIIKFTGFVYDSSLLPSVLPLQYFSTFTAVL